jgi:hypothetical protein
MPAPLKRETHVGLAPKLAGIALIALIAGAVWWQSVPEPVAPVAAAEAPPAPPAAPKAPPPTPPAVAEFAAFAAASAPDELPLDHGYTAEGMRQLARALSVSGGSMLWRDRAKRLDAWAASLARDPNSLDHANIAREAFLEVADWLGEASLREAAEAIRAEEPLRVQKAQVERCFRAAAAALQHSSA